MPPPPPRPVRSIARRFVRRNRWLLVAVAAVLVVWFDVYVFAHYQAADAAAPDPQQQVVLHPRPANGPIAWSPRAQLVRGLKYLNGTGVQVDVDKAHLWLERAALRGNAVAQNLMGVLYQTGTGVRADTPAAIRWYEAAAMQGNLQAMTNLGKVYAGGWKEGTDYVKAAVWFAKAAQYGEVDAQFDLAVLYELGQGVSRDRLEAYKWYMIAGKNGDSHAATRAAALASELEPEELQAADAAVTGYAPIAVDRAANDVPVVSG
jgi:localization factor PodJL